MATDDAASASVVLHQEKHSSNFGHSRIVRGILRPPLEDRSAFTDYFSVATDAGIPRLARRPLPAGSAYRSTCSMRCASCCVSRCHEQRSAAAVANPPAAGLRGRDVRRAGPFQDGGTPVRRRGRRPRRPPVGPGFATSTSCPLWLSMPDTQFLWVWILTVIPLSRGIPFLLRWPSQLTPLLGGSPVRRHNFGPSHRGDIFHIVRSVFSSSARNLLRLAELKIGITPRSWTKVRTCK